MTADGAAHLRVLRAEAFRRLAGGDLASARALFAGLTRLMPDDGYAWLGLGEACEHADDLEGAAAAYREACRLRPHDPEPWLAWAEVAEGTDSQMKDRLRAAARRVAPGTPQAARLELLRRRRREGGTSCRK